MPIPFFRSRMPLMSFAISMKTSSTFWLFLADVSKKGMLSQSRASAWRRAASERARGRTAGGGAYLGLGGLRLAGGDGDVRLVADEELLRLGQAVAVHLPRREPPRCAYRQRGDAPRAARCSGSG